MQKFYFKKYYSVYKAGDKICVGLVGDKDFYAEFENNIETYELLEKVVQKGVLLTEIKENPILFNLYNKGFLSEKIIKTEERGKLFLEYLDPKPVDNDYLNKNIMVFGAGGGGSILIYMLAQYGFKNISVVDSDIVEKSDVDRITVFDQGNIDSLKVETLREKILVNFGVQIEIEKETFTDYDNLNALISEYEPEIIVKACDPAGTFIHNLNKLCFNKGIPYITLAYSYEYLRMGPLFIPGVTSCYNSITIREKKLYGDHYETKAFQRLFEDDLIHPSISFNINILSSLIFKEILFFLKGDFKYCQTIGRLMIFNPLNMRVSGVHRECENCNICNYSLNETTAN